MTAPSHRPLTLAVVFASIAILHVPVQAADPLPWLRTLGDDFLYTTTSPARMAVEDAWRVVGFAAVGSAMVLSLDERVDEHYGQGDSSMPFRIPDAVNAVGDYYDDIGTNPFLLGSAAIIGGVGLVLNRSDVGATGLYGLEAVLFTKVYTQFFKRTLARARPFANEGPRDFDLFHYASPRKDRSMPSGHTSSVFAFAAVLAERHRSWWVRIPTYGLASCVAFQRVYSRDHWLSDTFLGAALGHFVGKTIARRHGGEKGPARVSVGPVIGTRQAAVLTVRF